VIKCLSLDHIIAYWEVNCDTGEYGDHRGGKADSVDPARPTYSIVPLEQIGTRSYNKSQCCEVDEVCPRLPGRLHSMKVAPWRHIHSTHKLSARIV